MPAVANELPYISLYMAIESKNRTVPSVSEPQNSTESNGRAAERLLTQQYCVFRSGAERYCLSVAEVEEVVEWPEITKVPLAPPYLMGIFNLRGMIIPVLDIVLEKERQSGAQPTHLVVAAWGGESGRNLLRVGLAADEMFGACLTSEPLLQDEAPNEMLHCCGILRQEGHMALALDLSHLAEAFPIPVI